MEIPEGLIKPRMDGKVVGLKRVLYGLKQAPRLWNVRIDTFLVEELSLVKSVADPNLYYSIINGKYRVFLLYVDDLILAGDNHQEMDKVEECLALEFEMFRMGKSNIFLGADLVYDQDGIWTHQRRYIKDLLQRYGMENCNPLRVPMSTSANLKANMSSKLADFHLFKSICGSLIYACNTRFNICFAVRCLSKFATALQEIHMTALKNILRYLKGTLDSTLFYPFDDDQTLVSFVYSDYGGCRDTRRSTLGIIHKLKEAAIDWSSKKQPIVALSTPKVEYRVLCEATKDIVYLRRLLSELRIIGGDPTPLLCDNQSSIMLVHNHVLHEKTKHIETYYHFVCEKSAERHIEVSYVPTSIQQADIFTKPLTAYRHTCLREEAGLLKLPLK